jgi:hypothetical protein
MTMLKLKKIILDAQIQPRVAISQDVINKYCQAHFDGAEFPPIVVFQDKGKTVLADGWHRYHAAQKAKITEINCDIRVGKIRDAIEFSLSANRTHGLNDSNSDKRRAVMYCINDKEWSQLSARKIAIKCGVSHFFVNAIYKELAEDEPTKEAKVESDSTSEKKNKGEPILVSPVKEKHIFEDDDVVNDIESPTISVVPVIPEGMELVDSHSHEETMENYRETLDQNVALQKIVDSDEPLKKAVSENKKLSAKLNSLESRFDGIMNEKNEAIRFVKMKDGIIKKQNAKLKELGAQEF